MKVYIKKMGRSEYLVIDWVLYELHEGDRCEEHINQILQDTRNRQVADVEREQAALEEFDRAVAEFGERVTK